MTFATTFSQIPTTLIALCSVFNSNSNYKTSSFANANSVTITNMSYTIGLRWSYSANSYLKFNYMATTSPFIAVFGRYFSLSNMEANYTSSFDLSAANVYKQCFLY